MPGTDDRVFVHHTLSTFFNQDSPCLLQRLPIQLLLDSLLAILSVGDVVALRKVNIAFFLLTHEPIIWRRFLKMLDYSSSCLPNYVPYTVQAADFKIESMVRTCLSVQRNWESPNPSLHGYYAFSTSSSKILEMSMLPGGEYAVASISDECGYRVTVTGLDGKFFGLASISTIAPPYDLQAQFMTYHGRKGIMVWFIVASDIEKPNGLEVGYTCHIAHIGMDVVETRCGQDAPSDEPFELLIPYTFQQPIHEAKVFVLDSHVHLTAVLLPGEVVIINVDINEARSFICNEDISYSEFTQQIRAVRMLADQGDVLIVRTVVNGPNDVHLLELYTIPRSLGRFHAAAKSRVVVDGRSVASFKFSEAAHSSTEEPLPISLYLETEHPRGVIHYAISAVPHMAYGIPPWWSYDLTNVVQQSTSTSTQDHIHVLPGTQRAVICTYLPDENSEDIFSPRFELTSLRRYFNPEFRFSNLLSFPKELMLRTQQLCGWRPKHLYRTLDLSPHIIRTINHSHISTIAWDEISGRACVATKHDRRMHVLDFGYVAGPDEYLQRFDSFQRTARIGRYGYRAPESPYSDMEMLDVIDMEDIPDDIRTRAMNTHRSLVLLFTYVVLGLYSILSLYSSVCIHQALLTTL